MNLSYQNSQHIKIQHPSSSHKLLAAICVFTRGHPTSLTASLLWQGQYNLALHSWCSQLPYISLQSAACSCYNQPPRHQARFGSSWKTQKGRPNWLNPMLNFATLLSLKTWSSQHQNHLLYKWRLGAGIGRSSITHPGHKLHSAPSKPAPLLWEAGWDRVKTLHL